MTSNEARTQLNELVAARTAAVNAARRVSDRAAATAWRIVENLDAQVGFAARQVEQAVRAENPGVAEAEVQRLTRAV